jgi:hypothetical protein
VSSYLDLAAKRLRNSAALQKQHRWWFVAQYDAIVQSPDGLAFELKGQALKVATAATGSTKPAGKKDEEEKPSPVAELFASSFTKYLPQIAEQVPVFAELQNLVGLSVAAELVARQARQTVAAAASTNGDDDNAGGDSRKGDRFWRPTHFLDESACPLQPYVVPRHVASIVNYRLVGGRHWMISVSGGVEISPVAVVNEELEKATTDRTLSETRHQGRRPNVLNRWWWD